MNLELSEPLIPRLLEDEFTEKSKSWFETSRKKILIGVAAGCAVMAGLIALNEPHDSLEVMRNRGMMLANADSSGVTTYLNLP